jgi:hypothetical protein
LEVRPECYGDPFPGFLEFTLSYARLKEILTSPDSYRDWHKALTGVGGVYLITDAKTGRHYVGSAAGGGGLLARWKAYARNGHGGNKRLRELIKSPARREYLSFTILEILDRSTADKEVLAREVLFKRKLGSRVLGLNSN